MPGVSMNKKSIKKNYMYNLTYQLLTLFAPLVTTPYISRVLGADGVGLNSYTYSVVAYFVLVAVLGTTDYGQREIAYRQDEPEERSRMFWKVFSLRAITSIFSLVLFLQLTGASEHRTLYLLQSVNILCVMADVTWFFQGMEDFGKTVMRNIMVRILNIVFIFGFVKTSADLPLYIASIGISTLAGHVLLWKSLPEYLCRISIHSIHPFHNLKPVLQLFLPQIAIQVSAVMDKTMLGWMIHSDFENGYYEQADRIEKICLTIVSSLGVVMIPRISYVIAKKQKELLNYYIYRAYRFIWFLALPMTFGLICVADQFVPWFFGAGYEKSVVLIRIFSVLLCVVGVSSVTGMQYFIPAGKQNQFTLSVVLGMIVNFILNVLLIQNWMSVGAAIATVTGELTVTVSQLIMARHEFSIWAILGQAKNSLIAAIGMSLILVSVKPYAGMTIQGTALLVLVGGIIYAGILLILRDSMIKELLQAVWGRWKGNRNEQH